MKTQPVKILFVLSLLATLLPACSQEDEVTYQLNSKLVELKCGKTFTLEVSPTLSGLTYTSLNANIATVSSSGVVKAGLVGTTKVVVKDSLISFVDTVKVVVNSNHTIFQDPYFGFGANQMTVEDNVPLPLTSRQEGNNGGYGLKFKDNSSFVSWWLYYMNKEGLFTHVELSLLSLYSDDLDAHVADRYMYMVSKVYAEDPNNSHASKFYINPDSSLLVIVVPATSELVDIVYYPANKVGVIIFVPDTSEFVDIVYYPANKVVVDQVLTNDTVAFYK